MCRQDTKAVPTALTGALGSKNYCCLNWHVSDSSYNSLVLDFVFVQIFEFFLLGPIVYF